MVSLLKVQYQYPHFAHNSEPRHCVKKGWVYKLQRGLHHIGMGWVWEKGENNRRNVWRNVKMRLIDIERQEIELQCSEKSSLHLQSDLMLNWCRCDYINSCNKDSRAGLAWLRLGAWKGNKIVNEEGERLCPLCKGNDSYKHILLQCVELEHVRRKYLPPSMLSQNRSSLACLDLMGNREWEQKIGLFLVKAKKIRTSAVEKSNIQQLKEEIREKLPVVPNTGTLRHSHKKSRPAPPPPLSTNGSGASGDLEIRAPSELLVGVPATLTTQWRHRPHVLVAGSVNYVANYLGSTVVKELRGTESTKKSIQKLKKSSSTKDAKSTPDIILAISYRGVKFLNTITKDLVCEHEIRNIHCACQDADDLTHFAYITKDHASKSHYCHVFCVQTMDQATEVILTLGQAFEVAYQMALRDQFTGGRGGNNNNNNGAGHMRSQSATHILAPPNVPLPGTNSSGITSLAPQSNHSRSLSVNEIKVNGQSQVKDMPAPPQNSKEGEAEPEHPKSSVEAEDPDDSSTGNQTSQAPIVVTEEL
ncbi:hypothetical protein ANN_02613 [Periplaneta americana]|uniref:PID domain-containing protein n=1 Tax=Periplaneta americana TaxID=6978 RepID=A0ABQ8TZA1_PERAM|nr:hypothetical protein ANN_02613 [Periplaneta americana]